MIYRIYYRQRSNQLERYIDHGQHPETHVPLLDPCTWQSIPGTIDAAHAACLQRGYHVQRYLYSHQRSAHGPHTWTVLLVTPNHP